MAAPQHPRHGRRGAEVAGPASATPGNTCPAGCVTWPQPGAPSGSACSSTAAARPPGAPARQAGPRFRAGWAGPVPVGGRRRAALVRLAVVDVAAAPPGFVYEWPAFSIAESRTGIDAQLILDAARRSVRLWPDGEPDAWVLVVSHRWPELGCRGVAKLRAAGRPSALWRRRAGRRGGGGFHIGQAAGSPGSSTVAWCPARVGGSAANRPAALPPR